ncbi:glutaredoxin 3 [Variovorax sp. OV329]|uniref:glutaredoxin 3 n=1 Tax=Variovorax sp. OV329 TaxID=1882825 RepID=UPI0008EEF9EB|nr:glutaredoxin 3 [Variovorax sp. OV329]SFM94197.1 glutaredoxin 3 [Variovorax sp. OV329]
MNPIVTMYMRPTCPYCRRAELLLLQRGATDLRKLRIDLEPELRAEMIRRTGESTVPQIFIGDRYVGGCDQLVALDEAQGLTSLLAEDTV